MGCDIHLLIQARRQGAWEDIDLGLDEDDERWWDFWEARSYNTFAVLADVRNRWDASPISKPRGLPEDSEFVDDRRKVGTGYYSGLIGDVERNGKYLGEHHHSWVSLAELQAVPAEDQEGTMLPEWIPELEKLGAPDDVRLVFGFDS